MPPTARDRTRDPGRRQIICKSRNQWSFRTDNDETHRIGRTKRDNRVMLRDIQCYAVCDLRDASISGRAKQRRQAFALIECPSYCVLTAATADQ